MPSGFKMFGSATLLRVKDKIVVTHADDIIAVNLRLLLELQGTFHRPEEDKLILDTAGVYRYQWQGDAFDTWGNRFAIYQREY